MGDGELAARIPRLVLEPVCEDHVSRARPAGSPVAGRRRLDSFNIVCLVGKGGFGKVFLVRHRASGAVYAMKVMEKESLVERRAVRDAHAERNILAMVGSHLGDAAPFIVRLHVAFQTSRRVYLVMDFASGGELMYHLRQEAMLSEGATKFYAAELLLALEALHAMDVVHRDIKPENLLLDGAGHLVLTDFGLAKDLTGLRDQQHSWCGSEDYMAPETLAREPHTGKPADYWAFGVFLFDCLVGEPPFTPLRERGRTTRKKLHERILKCKYKLPTWLSRECHSLIRGLITRDPEKRLTPAQIRAHPWFKEIDWDAVRAKKVTPPIIPNVGAGDGVGVGCFSPSITQTSLSNNSHCPSPVAIPGRNVSARGATPASSPGTMSHIQNAAPHDDDDSIWGGFSFVAPGMESHFALAPSLASPKVEHLTPILTSSLQTHTLAAERAEFSVDAAEAVEIFEDAVDPPARLAHSLVSVPPSDAAQKPAGPAPQPAPLASSILSQPLAYPAPVPAYSSIISQLGSAPGVAFVPATEPGGAPAGTASPFSPALASETLGATEAGSSSSGGKQRRRRKRKKAQRQQQAAQKNLQTPQQLKPQHQLKIPPGSGLQ